jgi:hypothetical protein
LFGWDGDGAAVRLPAQLFEFREKKLALLQKWPAFFVDVLQDAGFEGGLEGDQAERIRWGGFLFDVL